MSYSDSIPSHVSPETTSWYDVHWGSVLGIVGEGAVLLGLALLLVVLVGVVVPELPELEEEEAVTPMHTA